MTAEQHVYRQLRAEILSGRLAGGIRLNQDEIAKRLGVSRTPVRHALRRLGSEGFITNRPNYGSVVTSLSSRDILELFEMRSLLEGFAASCSLANLTDADIGALLEMAERLDGLSLTSREWLKKHNKLHSTICGYAKRPMLQQAAWELQQRTEPYVRLYLSDKKDTGSKRHRHITLINTLSRRNTEEVEQVMRMHVMSSARGVIDLLASQEIRAAHDKHP
ncbi:GntR family transcriptional regulator [Castellaniella sp. GW247-6E4]|uniref:GntR family transcriptional regulator n=1 Tax=Castellaniella sp. GW247-6E4 TaxID=3140380 RepID=UPI003314B1A0